MGEEGLVDVGDRPDSSWLVAVGGRGTTHGSGFGPAVVGLLVCLCPVIL